MNCELYISRSHMMMESNMIKRWFSGKRICLPMQEMQETLARSLGPEDALEEEMTTHSSILVWRISWAEKPGGLWSMGLQRIEHY